MLEKWKDKLAGYRLERFIGAGGSSCVFMARQHSLDREVAVKLLLDEDGSRADWSRLLKREGKGVARLSHPNIVYIIDFGMVEEHAYLLMEYVDAPSLAEILSDGPLPWQDAVDIILQSADALQYAHEQGAVHRDVKPSNILVNEAGHVKLLDFGIASFSRMYTQHTDSTLVFAGSLPYLPPERLRMGELSTAAVTEDVYSLGAVFYEMLTGFTPHGSFPPLGNDKKELQPFEALVSHALCHDPAQRLPTAGAFATKLREIVGKSEESGFRLAIHKDVPARRIWQLMGAGAVVFVTEVFLIGFSNEERFSLPSGPGSRKYDTAVAMIACTLIIIIFWTMLLVSTWRACRHKPEMPSRSILLLCYLPIVICTVVVVYLAVKD